MVLSVFSVFSLSLVIICICTLTQKRTLENSHLLWNSAPIYCGAKSSWAPRWALLALEVQVVQVGQKPKAFENEEEGFSGTLSKNSIVRCISCFRLLFRSSWERSRTFSQLLEGAENLAVRNYSFVTLQSDKLSVVKRSPTSFHLRAWLPQMLNLHRSPRRCH